MKGEREWGDDMYRHENHSPFGEIRRFETKIGDLRESCRFDEKMFKGGEGGCKYSGLVPYDYFRKINKLKSPHGICFNALDLTILSIDLTNHRTSTNQ